MFDVRLALRLALYAVAVCAQRSHCDRVCQNGTAAADGRLLTWTGAEFRFECDTVDALLRDDGRYVPKNNIALRGQICGDVLYLAYPRLRSGVPATLATTCLSADMNCEALMAPYPSLSVQEQGKSGDLQNAVDLFLDAQDVLWVLDTGVVQTLDADAGPRRTGPATVWAFDLNTRKVILGSDGGTALFFRYEASPKVYRWDATKPFVTDNFVPVYESGACFLATHVMADRVRNRLMVLETNFSDFAQNTVGCGIVHNVRVLEGCF